MKMYSMPRLSRQGAPLLLIALFALLSATFMTSIHAQVVRAPDHQDTVTGSCKAFVQAANRGVSDDEGALHAGACGYTRFRPLFEGLDQGDYLDAVKKNQLDPPFKIESYPGDPIKDAGRFCARAHSFTIDLRGEVHMSMLDWQHGKKPNSECAKEWQRLKQVIKGHEERHVSDVRPVVDAATARLKTLNLINCAASDQWAIEGLAVMIGKSLNDWFQSIKDDWDKRQKALDSSGADKCSIDCSKCADKKISFSDAVIDCTISTPQCKMRMGQRISGSVCGDPVAAVWKITPHYFAEGCHMPPSDTRGDKPFDNDCVPQGSDEEKRREAVYKGARGTGAGGWMCVYSDDPKPKVTIRSFRLSACAGDAEQRVTVDAKVSDESCDESPHTPTPPPSRPQRPVPVLPNS
jgi:hypothetical protein